MPIQCKNPLQLEGIAKIGFANNERLLSLHALYYGIALTHPRGLYPLENIKHLEKFPRCILEGTYICA
jgi:hypothetical protein